MAETTEQQMLEMADQMKDIVEMKDIQLRQYKIKYMDAKKLLAKIYGIIRIVQQQVADRETLCDDDLCVDWCIAEIRGNISDYLFEIEEKALDIYGY
tara:strand:+ start:4640 stop:4930 length:291 start_codon:yes stop_codon:yes gene_type:complete